MSSPADVPAYQRIAADLRQQITSGELAPDAQLPTEHVLAQRYGVARQTVRSGIRLLVAEGLVVARRPLGHFVRSQEQTAATIEDLAAVQADCIEQLERHAESLTAVHHKLDQIITLLGRLTEGPGHAALASTRPTTENGPR